MEPTSAWSETLDLVWRPCLDFYDERVRILRELQSRELLRQFRMGLDDMGARLLDNRSLTVGVTGLRLVDPLGALPDDVTSATLSSVFAALRPSVTELVSYYQHLYPLDWATDEPVAFSRAANAIVGPSSGTSEFNDVAVLLDGTSASGTAFQIEFGVITADDAPLRLLRRRGNRIQGPDDGDAELQLARTYPQLSLFADSSWSHKESPADADDLSGWVLTTSRSTAVDAMELVESLHRRVDEDVHADETKGAQIS